MPPCGSVTVAGDAETAKSLLLKNKVAWVLSYDADRTVLNSAAILDVSPPAKPLAAVLDRAPSQAPPFLELSARNSVSKLFRVRFLQEKEDFRR